MSKKVILEDKYILGSGCGSWAKSFENGICLGDVRVIGGVLMKAQYIYPRRFRKTEVNWTPVDDNKEWSDLSAWVNK